MHKGENKMDLRDYEFIGYLRGATEQLRYSKAHIQKYIDDAGDTRYIALTSYFTRVVLVDDIAKVIYLSQHHDCSTTTKKHVRKFLFDYLGITIPLDSLRNSLSTDRFYGYRIERVRNIELSIHSLFGKKK